MRGVPQEPDSRFEDNRNTRAGGTRRLNEQEEQ